MTGPDVMLATARGYIGYTESPAGSNQTVFGAWFGENGVPWCDIFVSYVADRAGLGGVIPSSTNNANLNHVFLQNTDCATY